jgi:hypothetical protein
MRALLLCLVLIVGLSPAAWAALSGPLQNDANSGGDASDYAWSPTPVAGDGPYDGTLVALDDPADWYGFVTNSTGFAVQFSMQGVPCLPGETGVVLAEATFGVQLLDSQNHTVALFSTTACQLGATTLPAPDAPPGEYRVGFTYTTNAWGPAGTHAATPRVVVASSAETPPAGGGVVHYAYELCHPFC